MKLYVSVAGEDRLVEARAGWSLMEAVRDAGVPIRAECGGGKACGTCHIHVPIEDGARLPAPDEEELELLSESDYYDPARSRLSCQILCELDLDDLRMILQPDATEA